MTNQENDGIKAIFDSYDKQGLELRIRQLQEEKRQLEQEEKRQLQEEKRQLQEEKRQLQEEKRQLEQERTAEEINKSSKERDLLAKQTREKLVEYALAADEIVDSPDFQEKFCSLIKSLVKERQSDSIDFILDALKELFGINLAVGFTSLVCHKIIKITVEKYCNSDDLR